MNRDHRYGGNNVNQKQVRKKMGRHLIGHPQGGIRGLAEIRRAQDLFHRQHGQTSGCNRDWCRECDLHPVAVSFR